jgi:hypothetical protein
MKGKKPTIWVAAAEALIEDSIVSTELVKPTIGAMRKAPVRHKTAVIHRFQTGQLINGGDRWEARWREDPPAPDGGVKRIRQWDLIAPKTVLAGKWQNRSLPTGSVRSTEVPEIRHLSRVG